MDCKILEWVEDRRFLLGGLFHLRMHSFCGDFLDGPTAGSNLQDPWSLFLANELLYNNFFGLQAINILFGLAIAACMQRGRIV